MGCHCIWLLPILSALLCIAGTLSGHFTKFPDYFNSSFAIPYIGNFTESYPETALFAQLLNMSAFFYILTFCAIHLQVVEFYGHSLRWKKGWWYITSLLILIAGLAGAFGLTLAANFFYSEGDGYVHLVGGGLALVGMLVYGWGHVISSYARVPRLVHVAMCHFRSLLMLIITVVFAFNIIVHYKKDEEQDETIDKIAGISEWGVMLVMQIFIITLVSELRLCTLESLPIGKKKSRACKRSAALLASARSNEQRLGIIRHGNRNAMMVLRVTPKSHPQ